MKHLINLNSGWRANVLALLTGALVPLSLAPYKLWPIGLLTPLVLLLLLQGSNIKQGFFRSFLFGLGMFGAGASWVYVAIHDFAQTPPLLAGIMTAMFVSALALVFALPFIIYCRFIKENTTGRIIGFSSIWVLGEWSRSWFLTGFPWLYIGYAHVDTWLAGWAPVLGVFSLSFFAILSSTLLYSIFISRSKKALLTYTSLLLFIWSTGLYLSHRSWQTEPKDSHPDSTISVAIIQPNIPLELKWNPIYRSDILSILREQTSEHLDKDLILWPEAAVPIMYHEAEEFLGEMDELANNSGTGIITGILYDDPQPGIYYNSIIGIGNAGGIYFKQRLVPFGEYVPLEKWLRGLINFFDLPNSIIYPGPKQQDILNYGQYNIAPSICYEIVYPDLVARLAKHAHLLVTISNDAWFGDSIGPMQHFQMAQMRALENQRYVIRATNTGVSGIINPKGQISLLGEQFVREVNTYDDVKLINTITPFARWGSLPIVGLCLIILVFSIASRGMNQVRKALA
ncbi:apolipoprotein N-acyltransferase [Agarilytica rhodophyticola]|uniref:apolipoprotein N-acyltransferase n=1 Tax=Agarilytica rhodophyticola TaxID=1737490 RepID=UPI000B343F45|nr:apolipoprotein N-acyltransferase [Agarilytica rhodophyticola]